MLKFSTMLHRALQGKDEQAIYNICLSRALIPKDIVDDIIIGTRNNPFTIPESLIHQLVKLDKPSLTYDAIYNTLLEDGCTVVDSYEYLLSWGTNISFNKRMIGIFQIIMQGNDLLDALRVFDTPLSLVERLLGYKYTYVRAKEDNDLLELLNFLATYGVKHKSNLDTESIYKLLLVQTPQSPDNTVIEAYNQCCKVYQPSNVSSNLVATHLLRTLEPLPYQRLLENSLLTAEDVANIYRKDITKTEVPKFVIDTISQLEPTIPSNTLISQLKRLGIQVIEPNWLNTTSLKEAIQLSLTTLIKNKLSKHANIMSLSSFFSNGALNLPELFLTLTELKKTKMLKGSPALVLSYAQPLDDNAKFAGLSYVLRQMLTIRKDSDVDTTAFRLISELYIIDDWLSNCFREFVAHKHDEDLYCLPRDFIDALYNYFNEPRNHYFEQDLWSACDIIGNKYIYLEESGTLQTPLSKIFGAICFVRVNNRKAKRVLEEY